MILGIDVAKDKIDICVLPERTFYTVNNTMKNINGFFKKYLKKHSAELAVLEPTGGYEKFLIHILTKHKIPHHTVHPNRVKAFAEAKGYYAKTDRIDAEILARYGQQPEVEANEPKSRLLSEIQELSSRKQQQKEYIQAERNRLGHLELSKSVIKSIKRSLKFAEQELERITAALAEAMKADESLSKRHGQLQTVKGVGPEVASVLVCDLPELGTLSRESISLLAGVAPRANDSGRRSGYRRIGGGRSHVRRSLYMSALVASRHNPQMRDFYNRLLSKGKAKKVALIAVARKLLITMNAMMREDREWEYREF